MDPQGLFRLSWNPEAPSLPQRLSDSHQATPFGAPPGYRRAERPETNIKYTFSPSSLNTMLLIPPANSPNSRPKFHVSVGMNPIIPMSYITTIRRGGTADGTFVAEFEMGLLGENSLYQWVTFDRMEHKKLSGVSGVFSYVYRTSDNKTIRLASEAKRPRRWQYGDRIFYWCNHLRITGHGKITCYASVEAKQEEAKVYAIFTPRTERSDGTITMESLEVTPEAHDFLDEILVSVLILERMRLSPSFVTTERLRSAALKE
ncbi:hypothetical protein K435DRAFT_139675 [Dendrothele bispora CBS 962.96]|uniref:Uncharacterized protein n=1 Tax=Dendrothele bispora (strain CBS 962.96) TaxID=1314807 RepID=A0A4S8LZR5_DENBC|nr:hypothetical protein K435DRAFT_139675 [Dendrothele bispora CBS 962.96]